MRSYDASVSIKPHIHTAQPKIPERYATSSRQYPGSNFTTAKRNKNVTFEKLVQYANEFVFSIPRIQREIELSILLFTHIACHTNTYNICLHTAVHDTIQFEMEWVGG